MKALVKLPDVIELLRHDRLPADLRELAFSYAQGGIEVTQLQPEDLVKFVDFTAELTARLVKYLAPPDSPAWDEFRTTGASPEAEGWQPVSLTAAEIREMDIDPADIEALSSIAGRQKTPNEVTALSRFDRGLLDAGALQGAIAADPDGRVGDFEPFRDGPAGDEPSPDGEGVREAPERYPRRERPGHRVRGRRSPST